ncbi:MAG: glucosamine-6-phosphate deaminase [Bacteroidales bacterium]
MRVIIEKNYDQMSVWAAEYVIKKINLFVPKNERRNFVLGLPTGSTPIGMYKYLIKAYQDKKVSFENVVTFNMDEYVDLDTNHPESYHNFMFRTFFNHVDCPKENIHIIDGNALNLEKECDDYEKAIQRFGGIDLFIGGVGSDGHLAFNEPCSSFASRTRVKTLTTNTVQANSRFFGNDINKVPHQALTVGIATIMEAKEVMILVNGHHKTRALQAAIEGPITQMWTISALQTHPKALIVCDEESTDELRVSTYKYFKDIERK